MKKYHPGYHFAKLEAGRMGENYWLRLTGKMLRSQKISVKRKGGCLEMEVGFTGTRARSRFKARARGGGKVVVNQAGEGISNAFLAMINDQIRPFVGVNQREVKRLTKVFIRHLGLDKRRRMVKP